MLFQHGISEVDAYAYPITFAHLRFWMQIFFLRTLSFKKPISKVKTAVTMKYFILQDYRKYFFFIQFVAGSLITPESKLSVKKYKVKYIHCSPGDPEKIVKYLGRYSRKCFNLKCPVTFGHIVQVQFFSLILCIFFFLFHKLYFM